MRSLGCALAVLVLAASAASAAQAPRPPQPAPQAAPQPPVAAQPASTPKPPAPVAPAPAPAPGQSASAPPAPESYTYSPDGRRDPFLSLLGTGGGDTRGTRRGEGATVIAVAEVSVRGVMQSRDGLIAMIQGPDNRTYIVRAGEKLADGFIKSITPQGLVIIQDVNDPLSLVKQREVLKLLRSSESAKE